VILGKYFSGMFLKSNYENVLMKIEVE